MIDQGRSRSKSKSRGPTKTTTDGACSRKSQEQCATPTVSQPTPGPIALTPYAPCGSAIRDGYQRYGESMQLQVI